MTMVTRQEQIEYLEDLANFFYDKYEKSPDEQRVDLLKELALNLSKMNTILGPNAYGASETLSTEPHELKRQGVSRGLRDMGYFSEFERWCYLFLSEFLRIRKDSTEEELFLMGSSIAGYMDRVYDEDYRITQAGS